MKRFLTMLLVAVLACNTICCATVSGAAAEEEKGVLDSIGSFFSNTWGDVSDFAENAWGEASNWAEGAWGEASAWAEGAWKDAFSWMEGAWGDASKWIEQTWNSSSTWAVEIWGDVASWTSETYENAAGAVGAWWTETFRNVTRSTSDAWSWVQEESNMLKNRYMDEVERIRKATEAAGTMAEQKVQEEFVALVKKLHLNDDDAIRIMRTLQAYAKEKGLSIVSILKFALPYLMQLSIDIESRTDGKIPAISVAQFLTGAVEKLGVVSETVLDDLLTQLIDTLDEI